MKTGFVFFIIAAIPGFVFAQGFGLPWSGYGNNGQHTAVSTAVAQPLESIHWSTPVDLNPPGGGGPLYIHYGSPIVTTANTVLVPVKTGATGGFEIQAINGATGKLIYTLPTDYSLPPHDWIPPYAPVLTLGSRLYYAGAGGTVYYRDLVDTLNGPNGARTQTGQMAFYGLANYNANKAAYNAAVQISTPLTADRLGNVYFGFIVQGATPLNLVSGIARISFSGDGAWVSAVSTAGGDNSIVQVAENCAPALSNDERTLYFGVSNGAEFGAGYLVSVDSATLAPVSHVMLLDPRGGQATVSTDSSASPMVGPDGDVYYGVLETSCCSSHNDRGWMLHFNSALTETKIPGSFGWDNTASVVDSSLVKSYIGKSPYLIETKYNNYAGIGTGTGVNQVAVLDPNVSMQDPYSTASVMKQVLTIDGPTSAQNSQFPDAVREWCINTAAIDPFTKSAIVNSEDGFVYRWDFSTNTFTQRLQLTSGIAEAYTPTVIGVDGTVYAINDAKLFAVGSNAAPPHFPTPFVRSVASDGAGTH